MPQNIVYSSLQISFFLFCVFFNEGYKIVVKINRQF